MTRAKATIIDNTEKEIKRSCGLQVQNGTNLNISTNKYTHIYLILLQILKQKYTKFVTNFKMKLVFEKKTKKSPCNKGP